MYKRPESDTNRKDRDTGLNKDVWQKDLEKKEVVSVYVVVVSGEELGQHLPPSLSNDIPETFIICVLVLKSGPHHLIRVCDTCSK